MSSMSSPDLIFQNGHDINIKSKVISDVNKKFFIETHGCQMNLADSDIVRSVLLTEGFELCEKAEDADLILTNTCAIRENAESKVWQRLRYFQSLRKKSKRNRSKPSGYPLIGVLGCMAERLKEDLLSDSAVDFIAGPDSYRTLPQLLQSVMTTDQKAANVILSIDETYADIPPVRMAEGNTHAFVTITRGCDNHCAFCVVPYTRGKERSRPVSSILNEIASLCDQGFKEIVLLGQNVNSYHDRTTPPLSYPTSISAQALGTDGQRSYELAPGFSVRKKSIPRELRKPRNQVSGSTRDTRSSDRGSGRGSGKNVDDEREEEEAAASELEIETSSSSSMSAEVSINMNDPAQSELLEGSRFGELLLRVAEIDPEMRIRFQSPHPKDFPDDVLALIAQTPNICNSLHMPAQHGSSSALDRMRRGYTRDSYLGLVERARHIIGGEFDGGAGLGLSTDLIAGFCGETEEEHQESLSLLRSVGYDQAFTYAYSRREQTFAGLFYQDDVPEDVKSMRLQELIDTFQATAVARNRQIELGRLHLVLVEGEGKGSTPMNPVWTGRTDTNKRVVFPSNPLKSGDHRIPSSISSSRILQLMRSTPVYDKYLIGSNSRIYKNNMDIDATTMSWNKEQQFIHSEVGKDEGLLSNNMNYENISKGKYVVVQINDARGHTLRGMPIGISSVRDWSRIRPATLCSS